MIVSSAFFFFTENFILVDFEVEITVYKTFTGKYLLPNLFLKLVHKIHTLFMFTSLILLNIFTF